MKVLPILGPTFTTKIMFLRSSLDYSFNSNLKLSEAKELLEELSEAIEKAEQYERDKTGVEDCSKCGHQHTKNFPCFKNNK